MSMGTAKNGTSLGLSEIRLKVQETDPRLDQDAVIFIAAAIQKGASYDRAEMQLSLQGRVPPVCRNRFYKIRRRVLDSLDSENARKCQQKEGINVCWNLKENTREGGELLR